MKANRHNIILRLAFILGLLTAGLNASAQHVSIGTNAVDWAALGTMNVRADLAVHRNWSIEAAIKYNPWTFRTQGDPEDRLQNRQFTASIGPRWWPWNVFAGWFIHGAVQYSEYNRGGIFSKETTEADAFGFSLSAGYTYLLSGHWNLEFGIGAWAGYEMYTTYSCPRCGRITGNGNRFFVLPNDVMVSIIYIF